MSSKIKYDIKSLDIGIDSKGNMALSGKGNLVTPIQPFSVRVNFGNQHVAPDGSVINEGVVWDCSRLRLVGNEKNSFASCIGGANAIYDYNEYRVKQNSGSYQVIANARNLAKKNNRYELAIFGAISVPGDAENARSAPVTVTVRWGFASTELTVFVCHEMKKLATAIIDFNGLSITLNKGTADDEPFECSPGSEIEIPIYAPYVWCADQDSRPGDNGEYFTESLLPIPEISYIWRNMDTVVTVEGDETEAEALAAAAFGVVASVEMRDYIVGDMQYWRSPQNDVIIGEGYKKRITVRTIDIFGKDHSYPEPDDPKKDNRWKLWIDFGSGIPSAGTGETRTIYRNAWDIDKNNDENNDQYNPPDDQLANYSVENCLVGESAPWFDCSHFGVTWLYYVYDDKGQTRHYGYCLPTGDSVAITNDPDNTMPDDAKGEIVFRKHQTYDGKYTFWINDDVYGRWIHAYPGKPYWSLNENNAMWEIKPDTLDDNGRPYHLIRSPYNNQTSVCFKHNGLLYGVGEYMGEHHGAVYELDTLKAWTVSPCSSAQISVYTDAESPAVDDDYYFYDKESKVKSFAGKIVQVGNSAYSITDKNGVKYYFKEDRSNDEEFE
jgi:hypothetical protein